MLSSAFTLLLLSLSAYASNVNLFHRIFIPGSPQSPFLERGVLDTSSSSFQPSPSLAQHLSQFTVSLQESVSRDDVDLERIFYQVALERGINEWDISSVKLVRRSRLPQTFRMSLISSSVIFHTSFQNQSHSTFQITRRLRIRMQSTTLSRQFHTMACVLNLPQKSSLSQLFPPSPKI
jgi:hypothetical protein